MNEEKKMVREIKDLEWLQQWKRKRRNITWISNALILMYGIEIQSVVVSMVYYLQINFEMNKNRASFYYTLIETCCGIGQITSCIFIGRYVDRTRNLRVVVLLNLMCIMIGNLLYAMPFHLVNLMIGRFLAGMNESLQTAICGEFRRCYDDQKLLQILGYYEVIYSIGINVGPGLTILFHSFEIRIGVWTINQYNVVNLIISFITFFLFVTSWFVVTDLSKEFDCKYFEENLEEKHKSMINNNRSNQLSYSHKMIGWKDLIQVDILTLSISYGIIRFACILACTVTSITTFSLFLWPVEYISTCHIIIGISSYGVITALVQRRVFEGQSIFFTYIIGCILAMLILTSLVLPRAIILFGRPEQFIYISLILTAKCFSYFFEQTQGKFLIFNTVNHESSSFVDSFRSIIGSGLRLLGFVVSYQYFITPIYFALPVGILQIFIIALLLWRKKSKSI